MPLHAIHRQDQAVRNHDTCRRLGAITQPVLLIHGRQDRMVPVQRAEELAAGLPHTELAILDPAGHQVHSEQFATVVDLVQRFIQRVESSRSG
jgi:pimeloyl-ACP methyl ester carboxylesterase